MLAGCSVLDCTDHLGWLAGRLLADLGATVTRIERPGADTACAEWRALNVNKQLVALDLGQRADAEHFDRLAAQADILLATPAPGGGDAERFGYARLARLNPRLVVVAITPFGLAGPKAAWRATDIELMAAGGAMSLAGERDSTPLRVSAPQAYAWTGAQAAVGALVALHHRAASGRGQLVDVSAQAAVVTALAHAPAFVTVAGTTPTRAGAYITGRSVTGARFRVFWPCRDGYVNFILYGGAAGRRTNEQLVAWMRSRGAELGPLAAIDWRTWDPTGVTQAEVDAIEAPIARFFAGVAKRDFLEEGHAREMLGYPVATVADIATDPQLAARRFWQDVAMPDGSTERHCGSFAIVDGVRGPLAPAAEPERQTTQRQASDPQPADRQARRAMSPPGRPKGKSLSAQREGSPMSAQALADVKIVEFGGYAAGPHIGKILANFGAIVVHVESKARPDGFRLQYPPFQDGKPGIDSSGCFAQFNDSKRGVTLDLKNADGLAAARRLADWCDVIVENMRPGVMDRIGLGYAALRQTNLGLVMLSTCNMGQTGPRADTPGFGSQLTALAGMCNLTGFPDGPPMLLYGPYIDFIASMLGASAVLAALERRRRTGEGAHIDVSQYECGLMFLAGPLLEYHRSGKVAERAGNTDPDAAPHGAYPARDGGWIALSCWSDDEFAALARAIGRPELAGDACFATLATRKANAAALDAAVSEWTRMQDAGEESQRLQAAGVHAHPVNTVADLFADPQLAQRELWRRRPHAVFGEQVCGFPAFDLSETPGEITSAAPRLGEHTEHVFRELLGMSAEEYREHRAAGAFE